MCAVNFVINKSLFLYILEIPTRIATSNNELCDYYTTKEILISEH